MPDRSELRVRLLNTKKIELFAKDIPSGMSFNLLEETSNPLAGRRLHSDVPAVPLYSGQREDYADFVNWAAFFVYPD